MIGYCFIFIKLCIRTGAIFHEDSEQAEIAFRYAIKRVNMYETSFELVPHIQFVASYDSFKTEKIGMLAK